MNDVVENSSRDGERIRKLREALIILDKQPLTWSTFERTLFVETVELWTDVLEIGTRFVVAKDASPGAHADAEQASFVSRMDQNKVMVVVEALSQAPRQELDAMIVTTRTALLTLRGEVDTVSSAGTATGSLPRLFADSSAPQELDTAAHVSVWRSRATLLLDLVRSHHVLGIAQEEVAEISISVRASAEQAKAAARQLEAIRDEIEEARAERAQGKLATQFQTLSSRDRTTSSRFRGLSFALLVIAAVTGVLLGAFGGNDWQATITNLAVVGSLLGASAYAARLASVHRGTADWAESIKVQLETFQDFLGVIKDEGTRHRVYEDFGRRVLGPPPVNGEEPSSLPAAQLLELLAAASRRPPREGA